jgi:hypothetical protein
LTEEENYDPTGEETGSASDEDEGRFWHFINGRRDTVYKRVVG